MRATLAIVGRPNVGKSTLFNRLVGRRAALVHDEPGVTRDRREGEGRLGDLTFTLFDTAGLEEASADSLSGRMQAQTREALQSADAVMFVVDARAGLTPQDRGFAELVRKSGKPIVLVANKSESRSGKAGALEAYALGFGDPIAISAEHGEGLGDLYDALREVLPREARPADEDDEEEIDEPADDVRPDKPLRVAIVGRPNAGKSTLINRLIGEERLLTGPEPGVTRDSIAVDFSWGGRDFQLHDTAGMRRKARIEAPVEKMSVADTLNAIRFAEVVVLLMDTGNAFEEQDLRIADLIEREGRGLVYAIGKWDTQENKGGGISKLRKEADNRLPQITGVPLVAVSGLTGEGLERLMQAVIEADRVWNKRVATAALNRWFEEATSAHPPPAVSGRRIRLNYITQAKARPPSFVIFCTRADAVPEAYKRYLANGLREVFDLPGTPIRLTLREKKNPFADKKR